MKRPYEDENDRHVFSATCLLYIAAFANSWSERRYAGTFDKHPAVSLRFSAPGPAFPITEQCEMAGPIFAGQ